MTAMLAPDQSFDFTPGHKRTPGYWSHRLWRGVVVEPVSDYTAYPRSVLRAFHATSTVPRPHRHDWSQRPLWARRTGRRAAALRGVCCPVWHAARLSSLCARAGGRTAAEGRPRHDCLGTERPRRADGPGRCRVLPTAVLQGVRRD